MSRTATSLAAVQVVPRLSRPSSKVIAAEAGPMARALDQAALAAAGDAKVLLTGETGVGKDLVAREIHAGSARAPHPFIAVNCAGFTEALLQSELFGHAKGSFTGAFRDNPGRLRLANHGTLFLDEVGDMSLQMQALLLRFLDTGELQPVGATEPSGTVDARIVSATNRDLDDLVASGTFREDLLYRLRVFHIQVPPLRERREDIRGLVFHAASKIPRRAAFSEEALRALEKYHWPGNVRELQNAVEQAIWASGTSGDVEVHHLPPAIGSDDRVVLTQERRHETADDLYEALVQNHYNFWHHIHPLFLTRDLTRHDVRGLVRRGLQATGGNFRPLLRLFGMPSEDYKRFLNFLSTHGCTVDFRRIRSGASNPALRNLAGIAKDGMHAS